MQSRAVGLAVGATVLVTCAESSLLATGAEAAVVRDIRAIAAASATRVIVEVEGECRYRTQSSPDGGSIFIDIADASLDEDATRMLPVSDGRVDGVILVDDEKSRIVRVAVDIAGRTAPRLDASVEGNRLVLTFAAAGEGASTAGAGANRERSSRDADTARPERASRDADADREERASRDTNDTDSARSAAGLPHRSDSNPPESPGPAPRVADGAARAAAGGSIASDARIAATKVHGDRSEAGASSRRDGKTAPQPPGASRRSVLEKPVVVLDPGHGGKDPGAKAWTGEYEKDIVLDLADRIARRLRNSGEVEVVMTRSGDEFVTLADRRDTSRRWNADAFVSIHANASGNGTARGIETYYHSKTTGTDRVARRLARLENGDKADRSSGKKSQTAAAAAPRSASLTGASHPVLNRRSESIRLARAVQGELVRRLEMRYEAVRDLGAKEGPFFVIGENAAPSVLVEAAFLTHREEGVRMGSEVYREQIADGVARGILAFVEQQRQSGAL